MSLLIELSIEDRYNKTYAGVLIPKKKREKKSNGCALARHISNFVWISRIGKYEN